MMTEAWVLIIMMSARSTDGGVAVNSIRFKSQEACQTAQRLVYSTWNQSDMGWPKPVAICVEDK